GSGRRASRPLTACASLIRRTVPSLFGCRPFVGSVLAAGAEHDFVPRRHGGAAAALASLAGRGGLGRGRRRRSFLLGRGLLLALVVLARPGCGHCLRGCLAALV